MGNDGLIPDRLLVDVHRHMSDDRVDLAEMVEVAYHLGRLPAKCERWRQVFIDQLRQACDEILAESHWPMDDDDEPEPRRALRRDAHGRFASANGNGSNGDAQLPELRREVVSRLRQLRDRREHQKSYAQNP